MGPVDLVDRMEPAAAEAGGDPGPLDRRLPELLFQGFPFGVIVSESLGIGRNIGKCLEHPALVAEFGGEDPPVPDELAFEEPSLEYDLEAVPLPEVDIEIDVPAEQVGEIQGQGILLAESVEGQDGAFIDRAPDHPGLGFHRTGIEAGPEQVFLFLHGQVVEIIDIVLEADHGARRIRKETKMLTGSEAAEVKDRLDLII